MPLHYDTETTGIPVPGVPSDDPRHPRLVSLSAILDKDGEGILDQMSVLIKPIGWEIDERLQMEDPNKPGKMVPTAFSVHGITNERAQAEGVPLIDALRTFCALAQQTEVLSAFSHHFDFKLLKIACAQLPGDGEALREILESKTGLCTMENAAQNLIGKRRIKLKEAHFQMFHQEIQKGNHNSLEDAMATRRIYWELVRRGHPMVPKALKVEYETPYQAAV